jgi:aminoglycoside phosphotransferase (APT) family kinase protein
VSEDLSLQSRLEHYYCETTDPQITISDFMQISDGWETEVYSFTITLRYQVEQCILRLYPGTNAAAKCEREYEGLHGVELYRYPVPLLMRHETSVVWLGKPFLIMRKINGKPLGDVMRTDADRQAELLTRFVQLAVDLHRLKDYRPDLTLFIEHNPSIYTPVTLAAWSRTLLDGFQQRWAAPVLDWLEVHEVDAAPQISPLHRDFHPHNVLITPDDKLYVIDWSGFAIGDYRRDLAWTLLLISTSGYPELRPIIISEYERLSNHRVENIEYFDVIAALRRLFDLAVSLSSGVESLGMRPETVAIMRQQQDRYQQVYDLLCKYTGLRIPEIERLLDTLRG